MSLCSTDVLPLFSAASGRKKQAIAFGDGVLTTNISVIDNISILSYIYLYMKTTVDISNALYKRCKYVISREHTTLRMLIEEGLNVVMEKHEKPRKFSYKPVTFKGNGLQDDFQGQGWTAIRDEIYKGHGA